MSSLVATPLTPRDLSAWGTPLSRQELDRTIGGAADLLALAVAAFATSVVIGMIDRWLFGGCKCR